MNIADNETKKLEELIAFADAVEPHVPDIFMCILEGYEGKFEALAMRNHHTGNYKITPTASTSMSIEVNSSIVRSRWLSAHYYGHEPEFYYS